MGYDLNPKNKAQDWFHFGAFSFPVLLEACGFLFPCIHRGGQWYCVFGADPRMPQGDDYPRLLSNDGFEVTDEEARIMARVARNFVTVQRSLPDTNRGSGLVDKGTVTRDDLLKKLKDSMSSDPAPPLWPVKIRDDFTDRFEKFAEWAEASGGFSIH